MYLACPLYAPTTGRRWLPWKTNTQNTEDIMHVCFFNYTIALIKSHLNTALQPYTARRSSCNDTWEVGAGRHYGGLIEQVWWCDPFITWSLRPLMTGQAFPPAARRPSWPDKSHPLTPTRCTWLQRPGTCCKRHLLRKVASKGAARIFWTIVAFLVNWYFGVFLIKDQKGFLMGVFSRTYIYVPKVIIKVFIDIWIIMPILINLSWFS